MKQKQITLTVEQAKDILNDPDVIKALIRSNFTEQELKGRVKEWEELGFVEGITLAKMVKMFITSKMNLP